MNLQKAEQAVKNAQNQLDEAMRQLEAAKDPWRHDEPDKNRWIFINEGCLPGCLALVTGERLAYPFSYIGRNGPGGDGIHVAKKVGWRYAEKGEVNISW